MSNKFDTKKQEALLDLGREGYDGWAHYNVDACGVVGAPDAEVAKEVLSDEVKSGLRTACNEINEPHMLSMGIMAVPVYMFDELVQIKEEQAEQIEKMQHNFEAVCRVLESATYIPQSDKDALSHIVIPGVNGPRPEHAHLDRDTNTAILRGREALGFKPHMVRKFGCSYEKV